MTREAPTLAELALRLDRLEGLHSTAWVAQGQQQHRNPMPTTRTDSPTIPPGAIEFRVYEGADHAYYWKALRGGHTIARAGAYDRNRDAVREIRRIVAAIQAGKVVITKAAPARKVKR